MRSLLFLFIRKINRNIFSINSLIVCVDLHVVPYLNGLVKLPYAIKTRKSVINFMHVSHVLLAVDIR